MIFYKAPGHDPVALGKFLKVFSKILFVRYVYKGFTITTFKFGVNEAEGREGEDRAAVRATLEGQECEDRAARSKSVV